MKTQERGDLETAGPEGGFMPGYLAVYRAAMLVLGVLLLGLNRGSRGNESFQQVLPFLDAVIAVWCLLHLGGLALDYRQVKLRPSARAQISADVVFSLTVIWITGGVESIFLPLLLLSILAASLILDYSQTLLVATAATLILTVMTIIQSMGWSPGRWFGLSRIDPNFETTTGLSLLLGQGLAIQCLAFLGARLMNRLRRAVRLNDLIVENIADGIVALDERGRAVLLNQEALRILGFPGRTDWRGKAPSEIFRRDCDREVREVLERRVPGEFQVEWRLGREERTPLTVRVTRIAGDRRERFSSVAVIRDRTIERRVAAAEARLRHLEEVEDLARGLVHEVRNPLASIRGCVQELGRGNLAAGQSARLASIVIRESDRLDRIVDEFLEYSRAGPKERVPVDLVACLREVIETLRERSDAQRVRIGLAGDSTPRVVLGHREMLYRVFLNLGINALEALQGTGTIDFVVGAGRPSGWVVTVQDNGPGMKAEVLRRIFNPFFSTKPREGGLGLAVVERIVHGHCGSIEVESEEGKGSRFRIWLPAPEPEALSEQNLVPLGVEA
ncbi:MAG: nitrogen regulation protein NR(II) [Planctomycetota bacterium]